MTLARGPLLTAARAGGYALGAFSVYNLEQAIAVCGAAEEESTPVIVQAGSSAFRNAGMRPLASLALAVATDCGADVGVHLDHSTDVDEIRACIELGYTSVMIDGSALPFEDNVELTKTVVNEAHAAGVWVEGELAAIAGDEDVSRSAIGGELTEPDAAARFTEATGVDALAVAVGNVHGIPDRPVALDLDRLADISERAPVPLVLHGASGLPASEIRAAVELGVAKLNVNTELRRAYRAAVAGCGQDMGGSDDLRPILDAVVDAVRQVARDKIRLFAADKYTRDPGARHEQ